MFYILIKINNNNLSKTNLAVYTFISEETTDTQDIQGEKRYFIHID